GVLSHTQMMDPRVTRLAVALMFRADPVCLNWDWTVASAGVWAAMPGRAASSLIRAPGPS
ncbi:hypothetical protein NPS74_11610, partial [Cutibacterium acnes subsp. acnes]|nr:hypothetical protein [Cutibacterium acnes subsp. acnes]